MTQRVELEDEISFGYRSFDLSIDDFDYKNVTFKRSKYFNGISDIVDPKIRNSFHSTKQYQMRFNFDIYKKIKELKIERSHENWELIKYEPGIGFAEHVDSTDYDYTFLLFPSNKVNNIVGGELIVTVDGKDTIYSPGEFTKPILVIMESNLIHRVNDTISGTRYVFKKGFKKIDELKFNGSRQHETRIDCEQKMDRRPTNKSKEKHCIIC